MVAPGSTGGPQERTYPFSQFRGKYIALGPGNLIAQQGAAG